MSKNKQTELETMTEERNHWRKLAQERQDTIDSLQRRLERMGMWENAFAGGVRTEIDNSLEQLQIERDEAKNTVQQIKVEIFNVWKLAGELAQESEKKAQQMAAYLTDALERVGGMTPGSIQGVVGAVNAIETISVDSYHRVITPEIEKRGGLIDAQNDWRLCLVDTRRLGHLSAIWDLGLGFALQALGGINDPAFIASDALMKCRVHGSPDIKTLNRLSQNWIDANIETGAKPSTICTALQKAHEFKSSGLLQKEFLRSENISERTLQKYLAWYEVFEKTSTLKPQDIQTKLEQELNAS